MGSRQKGAVCITRGTSGVFKTGCFMFSYGFIMYLGVLTLRTAITRHRKQATVRTCAARSTTVIRTWKGYLNSGKALNNSQGTKRHGDLFSKKKRHFINGEKLAMPKLDNTRKDPLSTASGVDSERRGCFAARREDSPTSKGANFPPLGLTR